SPGSQFRFRVPRDVQRLDRHPDRPATSVGTPQAPYCKSPREMKPSILLATSLATILVALPAPAQSTLKTGLQTLPGETPLISDKAPFLQYNFDLTRERFFVAVPKNYSPAEPFGLLVFMSPVDIFNRVPTG